ncbi:MAG: sulfurtransferase [Leptolyngbya foveolarum]|uniref:Sulfurtransferase n=1 Tax=Leptolyngbya foveolarum TaxID=47253 RepID=A0A2W4VFB8_9CYAN|nr:MAG: sulfurtransferase [Leptolyngbya foveolarum]
MPQFPYLVDAQWLSQHVDDPGVVVIDVRFSLANPELGRSQYQAGHIPGAYYLDLNEDLSGTVKQHGGRHPLPDWPVFVEKLNQIGINSALPTRVVIYDGSRFAFASRLWWMLRYLGHEEVAILDGGIQAWESAGRSLSKDLPAQQKGSFEPRLQKDWTVDIRTVRQRKDGLGVTVVDARSPERFRGEVEPIDPIAGSIPGAINAFWQNVSTAEGYLKSADALAGHWSELNPMDNIVVYCGSGVTACVNLFSMAVAGHPMYKLYPGGWSDWCAYLEEKGIGQNDLELGGLGDNS